jgi:hypothetical protein
MFGLRHATQLVNRRSRRAMATSCDRGARETLAADIDLVSFASRSEGLVSQQGQ